MRFLDDTIAAVATPAGEGGIGIVRVSGPDALRIAIELFRPSGPVPVAQARSHTLHHGHVVWDGTPLDEALLALMRRPHSYTREDVVEFQGHGSPVVLRAVLEAVVACGARRAEPGEFTQRAFLNGRLSLDQAQGVLDLIQAKTRLSARFALDRLEGKFTRPLRALGDRLTDLLAGVAVGLDYPEYEQDALPRAQLERGLRDAVRDVAHVLARGRDGRLLREGYRVAIVGRPNVGKSTLLNALLRTNRAIVSSAPGTTRDTLEEVVALHGVPFRLVDTAGLRAGADEVERLGVERARAALREADLALLVFDLSAPPSDEDARLLDETNHLPRLLAFNKADVAGRDGGTLAARLGAPADEALPISAKTGAGMDNLERRLARRVWDGQLPKHEDVYFLDERERESLARARLRLAAALETAGAGGALDLVAQELEEALALLGELTGEQVGEAVVERIFQKFCVGK